MGTNAASYTTMMAVTGFNVRRNTIHNTLLLVLYYCIVYTSCDGVYIGFSTTSNITINESETVYLNLSLTQSTSSDITVSWLVESSVISPDDIINDVISSSGEVVCLAGAVLCTFSIDIVDDGTPELSELVTVTLTSFDTESSDTVAIDSSTNTVSIIITESDDPYGVFTFSPSSRMVVVESDAEEAWFEVARSYGSYDDVTVTVDSKEDKDPGWVSGVSMYSAIPDEDYDKLEDEILSFTDSEISVYVSLTLTPQTASDSDYPKILQVLLSNPTNGASIDADDHTAYLVIVEDSTDKSYWDRYSDSLADISDDSLITEILDDIQTFLSDEQTDEQLSIINGVMSNIIDARSTDLRELTSVSDQLMTLFCQLLDPSREDTKGSDIFSDTLDSYTSTLASVDTCDTNTVYTDRSCQYVNLMALYWPQKDFNNYTLQFRSGLNYIQFPTNLYPSDNETCELVHYIEYSSSQWFLSDDDTELLDSVVLSVDMRDTSPTLQQAIIVRVYNPNSDSSLIGAICSVYNDKDSTWETDYTVVTATQSEDYVDCSFIHLSIYAVMTTVNPSSRTDYTLPYYICIVVCIACLLLTIMSHHICSLKSLLPIRMLMHMLFACMVTQSLQLINVLIGSDIDWQACMTIGVIMHYFYLSQFSWLLLQSVNLWHTLLIHHQHNSGKYPLYFFFGWGIPLMEVGVFIVVLSIGFKFDIDDMYGDLFDNGEMCFILNPYAMAAGAVAPVIFTVVPVCAFTIHMFFYKFQWKHCTDIYIGKHNIRELVLLLLLYLLLICSMIATAVHNVYGQPWSLLLMYSIACAMGVYTFLVYALLHNQMCLPQQSYSVKQRSEQLARDREKYIQQHGSDAGSVADTSTHTSNSRVSYNNKLQTFVGNNHCEGNHYDESYRNSSHYNKPSHTYPDDETTHNVNTKLKTFTGPSSITPSIHPKSRDFDDLLFALKTGEIYTPRSEDSGVINRGADFPDIPDFPSNHYEMKRLAISDSHL